MKSLHLSSFTQDLVIFSNDRDNITESEYIEYITKSRLYKIKICAETLANNQNWYYGKTKLFKRLCKIWLPSPQKVKSPEEIASIILETINEILDNEK